MFSVFASCCGAQMFFATSKLHVHLMQWDDVDMVERALARCDEVWNSFELNKVT